jgi:TusA-related sulfurtransferase
VSRLRHRLVRMDASQDTAAEPVLVDATGKACPVPVIDLAKAIAGVEPGDAVLLLADDPGAKVDIPVWCRMKRQELVTVDESADGWRFLVRRAV